MRHARVGLILAALGALGLGLWVEGCLFAPDECSDLLKCPGKGSGGGTSTSASTSASTGGAGGGSTSSSASTSSASSATTAATSTGTGGGAACLSDSDCNVGTTPTCDIPTHTCISCSDGVQNGQEIGVDCGGICKGCLGDNCLKGPECATNQCVDGRCCDTACTGVCMVCNFSASVGTCTNTPRGGLDSITCPNLTQACDGAGACKKASGQSCMQDSECGSGVCFAGVCRVHTGDNCPEDVACASGHCKIGKCADCSLGAECASMACSAGTCKAPGGAPCEGDADCAGGSCQYGFCQRLNNSSCSVGADCLSRFCSGGTCQPCANNANCPGSTCGMALMLGYAVCRLPQGAFCSSALPPALACNSGSAMCTGFPAKCQ